jgi:hypothetical protein
MSIGMMRYRLRTLLIVLALGPIVGAWGWSEYSRRREIERQREAWQQELQTIDRLRRGPTYQGFQLDAF